MKKKKRVEIIVFSKGQLGFENAWLVVTLLIVGLGLVFGLQAFSEINDDLQADLELSSEAKSFASESVGNAPTTMDNVFLFFVIGLWALLLVGAYISASNPIFTFIAIILGVFGLIVTVLVGNVYAEAMDDDEINDFTANFPKMSWILENILIMAVFITFSVMLVLYASNT